MAQRDLNEISDRAKSYANIQRPKPPVPSLEGGVMAMMAAGILLIIFSALSGNDLENHPTALAATLALAFLGVWWPLKYLENQHKEAYWRERHRLEKDASE